MRFLMTATLVLLLVGCQEAPQPATGTAAWLERVERAVDVSDGQGHGPDTGSGEWCDAVYFKLFGQRPEQPGGCSAEWREKVDAALRKP